MDVHVADVAIASGPPMHADVHEYHDERKAESAREARVLTPSG